MLLLWLLLLLLLFFVRVVLVVCVLVVVIVVGCHVVADAVGGREVSVIVNNVGWFGFALVGFVSSVDVFGVGEGESGGVVVWVLEERPELWRVVIWAAVITGVCAEAAGVEGVGGCEANDVVVRGVGVGGVAVARCDLGALSVFEILKIFGELFVFSGFGMVVGGGRGVVRDELC